ncbi:MAG TPA: DUF6152 family protein [Gammaproteobacteria bacterium]
MGHRPASPCLGLPVCAVCGLLAFAPQGVAHHSTAEYDSSAVTEARGEVVRVLWRNPHVRLQVSTEAFDGDPQLWEIEGTDLTRLDRAGVPHDLIEVGDVITFAGNPSMRRARRMYVTNVLLADGREILLRGNARPRWSPDRIVNTDPSAAPPSPAASADRGFFGKVLVPSREGRAPEWLQDPPLTEAARAKRAAYDAVTDDPVLGCVAPGMPRVITRSGPYAIRFVARGADLVLQNEWFEIDRLIHMDGREPPRDQPYTPLGYSAGRWDGDALVITTTRIDWPYFQLYGLEGVPQSRAMRIVERFTPNADGSALRYDISATDPATFTETVTYEGYITFRWQPSVEFLPYECVEGERAAGRIP